MRAFVAMVILTVGVVCASSDQTDDADYVYVRELSSAQHDKRGGSDSPLPDEVQMAFQIEGKSVKLNLKRNKFIDINAPMNFEGESKDKKTHVPTIKNAGLYHDKKRGAAITLTAEDQSSGNKKKRNLGQKYRRTMYGSVYVGETAYFMEPASRVMRTLSAYLTKKGIEGQDKRVLHKITKMQNHKSLRDLQTRSGADDSLYPPETNHSTNGGSEKKSSQRLLKMLLKELKERESRKKRADLAEQYYVGMMFLLDHTIYESFMDRFDNDENEAIYWMKYYFSFMVNGIGLAYGNIDGARWGFEINIYLTGYQVAKRESDNPWTPDSTISRRGNTNEETESNIDKILKNIGKWHTEEDRYWGNPDHAMAWTKYNIENGGSTSVIGMAWIKGVCITNGDNTPMGNSIIQDTIFNSWSTAAHELGHNLGAEHDGSNGCSISDSHIMTPNVAQLEENTAQNAWEFSDCSIRQFKELLRDDKVQRVCTMDRICDHIADLVDIDQLPGEKIPLDDQCEEAYGENSINCNANDPDGLASMCWNLRCSQNTDDCNAGTWYGGAKRAAEGSPCGDGMWCRYGQCVDKDKFPPTTIMTSENCSPHELDKTVPDGCTNEEWLVTGGVYINNIKSTCKDIPKTSPQQCFQWNTITTGCCEACHAAGLQEQKPIVEDLPDTGFKPAVGQPDSGKATKPPTTTKAPTTTTTTTKKPNTPKPTTKKPGKDDSGNGGGNGGNTVDKPDNNEVQCEDEFDDCGYNDFLCSLAYYRDVICRKACRVC